MFSLPSPRSSKLTTSAPEPLTLPLAEWNFGASAPAGVTTMRSAATIAANRAKMLRVRMAFFFRTLHLPSRSRQARYTERPCRMRVVRPSSLRPTTGHQGPDDGPDLGGTRTVSQVARELADDLVRFAEAAFLTGEDA